jgi:tRNA(Arg) A34 adenosine deaminase TadA
MITPDDLMRIAIDACRRGIQAGQTPFGCAIARDNRILAACHNTVWLTTDITAHAEINAIREACRRTKQISLEGCIVASTCEPCPMCASALHWARVERVYYGATIDDARVIGFNELKMSAETLLSEGSSRVELAGNVQRDECQKLFALWKESKGSPPY